MLATAKRRGVTVHAAITVRNSSGAVVKKAKVYLVWTRPDGSTASQTAKTGNQGVADFDISGSRGTYCVHIAEVTKDGFTFDTAQSQVDGCKTK